MGNAHRPILSACRVGNAHRPILCRYIAVGWAMPTAPFYIAVLAQSKIVGWVDPRKPNRGERIEKKKIGFSVSTQF